MLSVHARLIGSKNSDKRQHNFNFIQQVISCYINSCFTYIHLMIESVYDQSRPGLPFIRSQSNGKNNSQFQLQYR